MKQLFLLTILILLSSCDSQKTSISQLSDSEIRNLMIGTWVCGKEETSCSPTKSTYNNDGTLDFTVFRTFKCEEEVARIKAQWKIENKSLILITKESFGEFQLPQGYTIIDKIDSISEKNKVLIGADGGKQFREKRELCLPKN